MEKIITINSDLRTLVIPESITNLGVQYDDDVRRLHFRMPRAYDGTDLSGFTVRINYMNAANDGDVYVVTDKAVAGDYITFSWLVGRMATAYKGNVRFIVCMKESDAAGEVLREFNTTPASLPVLEGLETADAVEQEYPDVLESILVRLNILDHVEDDSFVRYTAQNLTPEQQAQVRENIGACDIKDAADKLAPAFTASGAVVTCNPVEGYPLEVVSGIAPVQSGTGEPNPENVRPISGHTAVKLTHENGTDAREITADFGQTVYGGSFNWVTGELVSNMVCLTFTGNEDWALDYNYARLSIGEYGYADTEAPQLCSHFKMATITSSTTNIGFDVANSAPYNDARVRIRMKTNLTLEEWIAFLKEQYANGTPVQVCFGVSNPTTAKLAAQEILALPGVNTLFADNLNIEVSGRADPRAVIQELQGQNNSILDRIAALEAAAVNNT